MPGDKRPTRNSVAQFPEHVSGIGTPSQRSTPDASVQQNVCAAKHEAAVSARMAGRHMRQTIRGTEIRDSRAAPAYPTGMPECTATAHVQTQRAQRRRPAPASWTRVEHSNVHRLFCLTASKSKTRFVYSIHSIHEKSRRSAAFDLTNRIR